MGQVVHGGVFHRQGQIGPLVTTGVAAQGKRLAGRESAGAALTAVHTPQYPQRVEMMAGALFRLIGAVEAGILAVPVNFPHRQAIRVGFLGTTGNGAHLAAVPAGHLHRVGGQAGAVGEAGDRGPAFFGKVVMKMQRRGLGMSGMAIEDHQGHRRARIALPLVLVMLETPGQATLGHQPPHEMPVTFPVLGDHRPPRQRIHQVEPHGTVGVLREHLLQHFPNGTLGKHQAVKPLLQPPGPGRHGELTARQAIHINEVVAVHADTVPAPPATVGTAQG